MRDGVTRANENVIVIPIKFARNSLIQFFSSGWDALLAGELA